MITGEVLSVGMTVVRACHGPGRVVASRRMVIRYVTMAHNSGMAR